MNVRSLHLATLPMLLLGSACQPMYATSSELRIAVDDIVATGQAASLEASVVEITTDFTLGEGLATLLAEVQAFVESQVPCSTVTPTDDHTLAIDFGTLDDGCSYRGRTFAGLVTVSYALAGDAVIVQHDYEGFTDGKTTLDGEATVTWRTGSRRIETDFDIHGPRGDLWIESDRTEMWIGDGIRVDGDRHWQTPYGEETWLEIQDVEMRAVDPVPQDGAFVLTNSRRHEITMTFDRKDEDTIVVTVTGGYRERVFEVSRTGAVDDLGDS